MPSRYFMDTSALIARFLTRAVGHRWMQAICDQSTGNSIAIAEITAAELASAFNQLARGGALRKSRCDQSLALFRQQVAAGHYQLVPVTWDNIERAATLCDVHPLRGYDAVQLACALAFREDARLLDAAAAVAGTATPGDPIFVTEDQRLSAGAAAEGFMVDSPLLHP